MSSSTSERVEAAWVRLDAALTAEPVDMVEVQAALDGLEAAGVAGMGGVQRWVAEVVPPEWWPRPRLVPSPGPDLGGAS